jgi:hypothetical protein
VSPALKLGCCLPVANASSATLIKSIFNTSFYLFAVSFHAQHNRPHESSCQRLRRKRLQRYEYLAEPPNISPTFSFCIPKLFVFSAVILFLSRCNYGLFYHGFTAIAQKEAKQGLPTVGHHCDMYVVSHEHH